MDGAVITLAVSAVSIILLTVLFRHEEARECRLFESLRIRLDQAISWLGNHIGTVLYWFGAGNVRLFFHAVLHRVLHLMLRIIKWMEGFVETKLRSNRRQAKSVSRTLSSNDHLRQLAEHQVSTALDEEQKKQLRSFK